VGGGGAVGLLGHSEAGREGSGQVVHGGSVEIKSIKYPEINETAHTVCKGG